ncbi:hypothetical protein JCM14076_15560 [Methylosoma difficile]
MSKLIFHLRGVPEDEALEVRDLLTAEGIDFYETTAGNWGVSMPAIWLKDDTDLTKAQMLLSDYQQQRYISQRQAYLQRKQAGQHSTIWQAFVDRPVVYIAYLLGVLMTVYVSIKWLYEMGL